MNDFIEYLSKERHKAENTQIAYKRDIEHFAKFLDENRNGKTLRQCSDSDAIAYSFELGRQNKSKSTINRKVSALRTYYEFLIQRGEIQDNPFREIKAVKGDNRQIEYLTIEEVERLIESTDDSKKGIRDRALMEFMYGTGARVTEVVRLQFADVNLRMSFVTLKDVNDESRIVPLGSYARAAMTKYIEEVWPEMRGREPTDDDFVFINFRGDVLTRQGIWKILKDYGARIHLETPMTPQILRDSFAVHILQNGGDLKTLQELMGFEDMSVGIAYLAVTDIHVRDVFKKTHPRA